MGYEIKSLTVGGIFDQAFRVIRDHFLVTTGALTALMVPWSLVWELTGMNADFGGTGAPESLGILAVPLLASLVFWTVFPLLQLQIVAAVSDVYLGRSPTIGETLKRASGLYLPYLGTMLLMGLLLMLLTFLFVFPAIYFGVCWGLIGPVALVEGRFGTSALSRSRQLVRGTWWRTLLVSFFAMMLLFVPSMAISSVASFIPVVGPMLQGLTSAITMVFGTAVTVLLYVDLRCRKEDFDLQVLADQVAKAEGGAPSIAVGGP